MKFKKIKSINELLNPVNDFEEFSQKLTPDQLLFIYYQIETENPILDQVFNYLKGKGRITKSGQFNKIDFFKFEFVLQIRC